MPFDSGRLVFPPVAAGVLAAIFYNVFALMFPLAIARSIFAGGLLGYITYDLMHYYLHHGSPTPGSYLHQLKRYHVSHHFEDQQKGGLNLTSRLKLMLQWMKCTSTYTVPAYKYLRNRKHALCFYRVIETWVEIWEKEKCCGNTSCRRVFSLLAPSLRQQRTLVLCLHRDIQTRFLTNQCACFLRTVFL